MRANISDDVYASCTMYTYIGGMSRVGRWRPRRRRKAARLGCTVVHRPSCVRLLAWVWWRRGLALWRLEHPLLLLQLGLRTVLIVARLVPGAVVASLVGSLVHVPAARTVDPDEPAAGAR